MFEDKVNFIMTLNRLKFSYLCAPKRISNPMCGCADVRMCGCADVRMCGCADVRISEFGFRISDF